MSKRSILCDILNLAGMTLRLLILELNKDKTEIAQSIFIEFLWKYHTHVMFYICIAVNTESENSDQGQIPAEEKESVTVPESPIPDLPPRSHRTMSVSIVV